MDKARRNEGKAVTIYDIAKEAGVSAATVSRVLTSNANVRQDKKDKVLKLMEKYDFTPNALARGLTDTRSKVIGIVAADVRNPFYSEMFVACELAASEYGYMVVLGNSLGDTVREKLQLEKFQEQRVDAVIQIGGRADDMILNPDYLEKVKQVTGRIPMVTTGNLEGQRCYQVRIDDGRGIELIMEHLLGLGHRRIAFVGGWMDIASTHDKFQRYTQLLKQYDIPFLPELVGKNGGYDPESGYATMGAMLAQGHVPTAVIAVNDFTVVGAMKSIREAGFRIPEDISVISHDNSYMAELVTPMLTSVEYHYQHFGEMLIGTAIRAIEGQEPPARQLVEPSLVVRSSTSIVRAS